jgi:glycerophosphoryl diester phosphodiesterase
MVNPSTQALVDSGWIKGNNASYIIAAGTQFRVLIARDVEDPTEIADIDTFTSGITVYEKGTEKVETLYNPYNSRYGYLNADGTFSGGEDQVTLTTDYIPVDATGTFSLYNEVIDTTKEAWCGMALFNEDKEIIARLTWQGRVAEIGLNKLRAFVQTPATCKFIRLSFRHWAGCKVQLNYGYNFGEYMPYQLPATNRRSLAYKYNLRSIAHRGWSYADGAPENTLPAFIQAKAHGFTFVETDVQFTSDDVPVCLHDRSVDRTTDGTGNIDSMTLAQAQALNADDGKTSYSGVQIPTFEAFIKTCRDLELIALVELKMDSVNYEDFDKYEILMNIVKKYDMQDRICWLGSNFRRLLPIRNLDPYACVCLLTFTDTDAARLRVIDLLNNLFKNDYNRVVYSADHRKLNSTIINACKNTDLAIDAWTLYNSTQLDALDGYVSGVTTEDVPYAEYLYDKLTEA